MQKKVGVVGVSGPGCCWLVARLEVVGDMGYVWGVNQESKVLLNVHKGNVQ